MVPILGMLGIMLRAEYRARELRLELQRNTQGIRQATIEAVNAKVEAAAARSELAENTSMTAEIKDAIAPTPEIKS